MDPFTQRMLEKAEQRSRALGVSNAAASQFPISEKSESLNINPIRGACATTMASQQQQKRMHTVASGNGCSNKNKLHVVEKNKKESPRGASQKVLRQFSALDKENMDLGIEINILTDKNVEVQVQVEEEVVSDDQCGEKQKKTSENLVSQATANIRDKSRNHLQRLGALYSNADDLSSPIHRTEGKFHAEANDYCPTSQNRKPNQRLGKLAALASTINQWEDDTSHHTIVPNQSIEQPPPKPELPSRNKLSHEAKVSEKTTSHGNDKNNHLTWDPKVMNSLEAQGFQRRESSTVKISYDFAGTKDYIDSTDKPQNETVEERRFIGKINTNKFGSAAKNIVTEKKSSQNEKKNPTVKPGLVSGRAAIFESQNQAAHKQQQQQQEKPLKDPTELSLKERMKLFEKNKGDALMPKAAFGMAAPINKIIHNSNRKKEEIPKAKQNVINISPTSVPAVKSSADSKVRDKVSALVKATMGNTIKEDIKKQREEDLQLLANRFNKQKELLNPPKNTPEISKNNEWQQKTITATPPPPPPPLPITTTNITSKRRSPGDAIDDDINKRSRTITQGTQDRLYPILPNIESTESSESDNENNWCTTATVSALSMTDEINAAVTQPLCGSNNNHNNYYDQEQDDDVEDSYMASEGEDSSVGIRNGSLGREIMQFVEKNDKQESSKSKGVHYADKDSYIEDNTLNSSNNSSNASMGVDDYLDEALDDNADEVDEDNSSNLSRNSKGTTASNSFSFRKANVEQIENNKKYVAASISSPNNAPVKSQLTVNKEDDNIVTLVHTVSFYRRQQNANSASSTPIRTVCREKQVFRSAMEKLDAATTGTSLHFETEKETDDDDTQSDSEIDDEILIQDKIKKLLDEVCKQQQVIAQTSQALNLCAATIEFSGSTESVEGERHLLVATHRRQACLDEVQRLRVERTLRAIEAPTEKGRLTVKDITIPLRQDYIRKLSLDTISGHHLVCLLKYNEHVLATKSVPTLPGLLSVKFPDVLQLNSVYADFKVTLEIYGMTAQREVLPHEVKYHINFNKKSGIKTPKKKGSENRLVMPPVQSPAGPHVVRTPALVQYGFALFSLRDIQRTNWTLTQVLGVSPLEGVVHMKVNCELSVSVEYKGFLTMFEDMSGFGAWHRRWCHLNGTVLNYWKYPDDEKKKAPMGTIDLYTCSSPKIYIAPRDICARLNTMLLECQRPAEETDRESLIIVPNGKTTIVRYLLSADTKQEREEWCAFINKSLTLLRAWGPPK